MPVKSGKSWTEAAKYCKENEGYLLKLDDIDRYYTNSQQGLGQYLYDEGTFCFKDIFLIFSTKKKYVLTPEKNRPADMVLMTVTS